jgi:hypothetical protein
MNVPIGSCLAEGFRRIMVRLSSSTIRLRSLLRKMKIQLIDDNLQCKHLYSRVEIPLSILTTYYLK